jgi:carbamoyltransferase
MYFLGISAYYHNSAAAIIADGKIIAAAEEERFTRIKNDPSFPTNAIKFCLEYCGVSINDLAGVVFYDKPFLKFERLIETYLTYAPKGFVSFLSSMPLWIRQKIFLKSLLYKSLKEIQPFDKRKLLILFTEHHLSHAASAFYPSSFEEAAILTIDGIGEWATTTICQGKGKDITVLKELHFPHSVGLLYAAFTYYCGFEVNSGEYKLMGLAPYGNAKSKRVNEWIHLIKENICTVFNDGSIFLNMDYFNFHTGSTMTNDKKWKELFGFWRRKKEERIGQVHCDLAYAIQAVTEEIIIKLATEAKRLTGADYLCMAGGVALNCVANGKLFERKVFKEIYIQPAAGDSGGALGAALAGHYIFSNQQRYITSAYDEMQGAYLGPEYSEKEVLRQLNKYKAPFKKFESAEELVRRVAALLSEGKIVAWHQSRMEFGPRALGARSILADPRNQQMQRDLNLKVKFRENFRPFAPIILAERVNEYFELDQPSPYMLIVKKIREEKRAMLPENFEELSIEEKLKLPKSELSAATHVDYTSRIQTVHREMNLKLWNLLNEFYALTGCPALLNTSFNVKDEPIVNTPQEAYECFLKTEIDYLVIGNLLFEKPNKKQ